MAKAYRRPLLVFYLVRPPKTGDRGRISNPSWRLRATVQPVPRRIATRHSRAAEHHQVSARRLRGRKTTLHRICHSQRSSARTGRTDYQATQIRLEELSRQATIEEAFAICASEWRRAASRSPSWEPGNPPHEHLGRTFRGFALADDIAPLVVVNDNDAASAWSFTTLHEVAHLWLGATGVSGWAAGLPIERYCSDVAADILLPPRELDEFSRIGPLTLDRLAERVSQFATAQHQPAMVAYRVFRAGTITEKTWEDLNEKFQMTGLPTRNARPLNRRVETADLATTL